MSKEMLNIQTPKGDFKYMFIAGQGRLKPRSKTDYAYSACVVVDKKVGKKFYNKVILPFFEENKPKKCKLDEPENSIYQVLDDGRWMFQFRTNTKFTDPKTKEDVDNTVTIFNAKNKEVTLPENQGIGEGSQGAILGALKVYEGDTPKDAGVSMFLNSVRISKYVAYIGSASFEDDGDEDGDFDDFDHQDFPTEGEEPKEKKKKKKKKKSKD